MLFNSYVFLFAFLPVTLLVYHSLRRYGNSNTPALLWLVLMSLFYYGWWEPSYLLLLAASIAFNYSAGSALAAVGRSRPGGWLLAAGICVNLAALGYFKYANFMVDSLNQLGGADIIMAPVLLPLAISFFTFQQITYLVDSYRGEVNEKRFLSYCLFVCFFPQLLSGPIVHHRDMMPQFSKPGSSYDRQLFDQGLALVIIGLFKKVVLADSLSLYATPVFNAAEAGVALTASDALMGGLGFTLQLYFDFSGYSDIAVGSAAMFGIRLIFNFASPLQSTSIIEFWRRWHMSLSSFLRDYLYVPLGGNRHGSFRRYQNLMITMLLGGLWHGAGWNFVLWGAIHGALLILNHGWRHLLKLAGWQPDSSALYRFTAWLLCLLAVTAAFVVFNAETISGAMHLLRAMLFGAWDKLTVTGLGANKDIGISPLLEFFGLWLSEEVLALLVLSIALLLIALFPNSQTLIGLEEKPPAALLTSRLSQIRWASTRRWAMLLGLAATCSILCLGSSSEFVYFQF